MKTVHNKTMQSYFFDKTTTDMVLLNINEFDQEHSPSVLKTMKNSINSQLLSHYDTNPEIHDALMNKLSEYNDIDQSHILLTNGADEAIKLIIDTYVDHQGTSIVFESAYRQYERFSQMRNVNIVKTKYSPDLWKTMNGILELTDETLGNVMVFICSPDNPTGDEYDIQDILKLIVSYPDVIFVLDRTYIDYICLVNHLSDPITEYTRKHKNLLVIRSFSKAFGLAGIRLGYIISHPSNITTLAAIFNYKNIPTFVKLCGLSVLQDLEYYRQATVIMFQEKDKLLKLLSEYNIPLLNSNGNFICAKLGSDFVIAAQQENILVRDINGTIPGHVRITIGNPENMTKLKEMMKDYLAKN